MTNKQGYNSVWLKWSLLNNQDIKERKDLISNLNVEVKKGFDVVVRIGFEEAVNQTGDLLPPYKEYVEQSLALLVFAGYTLFLVANSSDPVAENLVAQTSTARLGEVWMESFEKDKGLSYVEKIDPILALLMEEEKNRHLLFITQQKEDIRNAPFEKVSHLGMYFSWAIQQGYIFGMIEQDLYKS